MKKNNRVISGRFVRVIYFVQTYMNQNGRGIIAPFRLSGGVGYSLLIMNEMKKNNGTIIH